MQRWPVPMTVRWCEDHAGAVGGIDDLYQRAKEDAWNPAELDWESGADPACPVMSAAWSPYEGMTLFQRLSPSQQRTFRAHALAQQISQLLHGAQGALLTAAAVAQGIGDVKAKCCAAAQVMDEARHMEVYERYLQRLAPPYPPLPWLKQLVEVGLRAGSACRTLTSANLIAKGLMVGALQRMYRDIREPLLKTLTFHVIRDASRHVSFGRLYVARAASTMHPDDREALAQFALDAVRLVQAGQAAPPDQGFMTVLRTSGIDPEDFRRGVDEAAARGLRTQPAPGQIHTLEDLPIPVLVSAGVVTARTQALLETSGIPVPADLELAERAHARRRHRGGSAAAR
jgi:hypothetical protein